MKFMKKLGVITLSLALAISMNTSVFAKAG